MNALRHPDCRLVFVLLLVLGLRALVPAGFMPASGMLVELCTADGLRSVLFDPASGEVLDDQDHVESNDCPWALVLVGTMPSSAASPATLRAHGGDPTILVHEWVRRNQGGGPPPVRAPPSFPSVAITQA